MAYEKPLGQRTVHVWLLYQHPFFEYGLLCWWDGIAHRNIDGQIDNLPIKLLDAPKGIKSLDPPRNCAELVFLIIRNITRHNSLADPTT